MPVTDDPNDPRLTWGSTLIPGPQAEVHYVLSEEERAKGFVRPVRRSYFHAPCRTVTTMGPAIAGTYARNPRLYGSTYCVSCKTYPIVGEDGEFFWVNEDGTISTEKVGT